LVPANGWDLTRDCSEGKRESRFSAIPALPLKWQSRQSYRRGV